MTLTLYTMRKEFNSTMRPGDEQFSETFTNVSLISPTNIMHPTFQINTAGTSPLVYNYIKADGLNRYYFIDNWEYGSGLWSAHCTVDVLGSFKPVIGLSTQYVVRALDESDDNIIDSLYPTKALPRVSSVEYEKKFFSDFDSGFFVIGVINNDNNAIASTSYYALDRIGIRSFCRQLLDIDVQYAGVDELSEDLFKSMINPLQYIVSCMWFPFSINELEDVSLSGSAIPYGYWKYSVPNRAIFRDSVTFNFSTPNLPQHPQSGGDLSNWLKCSPYTKYTIVDPVLGTIPLDPSLCVDATPSVSFSYTVDLLSGASACVVSVSGRPAFTVNTQIGVAVNLSQASVDFYRGGMSMVNAVGSGFGRNIGGIFSNIGDGLEALSPTISTVGGSGNTSMFEHTPSVLCEFRELVTLDPYHQGFPCCKNLRIDTLSGYVKCANAHIDVGCLGDERRMIEDYLNGGFYYE